LVMEINLLGHLTVRDDTGRPVALRTAKARAVLGILALARGARVPRGKLAGLLWDRFGEEDARANLRRTLHALTAALGRGENSPLRSDRHSIWLDLARCRVDLLCLQDEAGQGCGEDTGLLAARPRELLEGLDGLSSAFDDWLRLERMQATRGLRKALENQLASLIADPSRLSEATAVASQLVQLDPTDETGWRGLMRLLAANGQRAQALREYEHCCQTLQHLLSVGPSPQTQELALELRQGMPALPGSQGGQVTNLADLPAEARQKLRIGVLPFSIAGPGERSATADAYAEDVAAELSRFRRFEIISPLGLGDLRHVRAGRAAFEAAGLDYVVTGSLRASGPQRRSLSVSLLDVRELAHPVWSDRVPLDPDGAELVEDEAVQWAVARVDPAILSAEARRQRKDRMPDATGNVIRAIPLLYNMRRDAFLSAGELLADAVARAPDSSIAAAWAAHWHVFQVGQGWTSDPAGALEEAERLAVTALQLDPESAESHAIYGHICAFLHRDMDSAMHYFTQALELNPHDAAIWALSAPTYCYVGDSPEALRRLGEQRRLAPFHPQSRIFETIATVAHTFGGDYDAAIQVGKRSVRANPDFTNGYKPLIAALGIAGRQDEARPFLEGLLRREPGFNVSAFERSYPFRRPEDRERYTAGLRLAGVPVR
jgi:DNA-binding SARP family transcriptional activator